MTSDKIKEASQFLCTRLLHFFILIMNCKTDDRQTLNILLCFHTLTSALFYSRSQKKHETKSKLRRALTCSVPETCSLELLYCSTVLTVLTSIQFGFWELNSTQSRCPVWACVNLVFRVFQESLQPAELCILREREWADSAAIFLEDSEAPSVSNETLIFQDVRVYIGRFSIYRDEICEK